MIFIGAACLLAAGAAPLPGPAQGTQERLGAADVLRAAETAERDGRIDDALTLLDALTRDPDVEVRSEARFRRALLLAARGRDADAAVSLRALLDERPEATPARLELARVLARLGDEGSARRALRQAQAAGLPPDVAAVVDQFAVALRSARTLGGSLQLALAPDTNVNHATDARTLDTVVAPLTLSRDARSRAGLGIRASGSAFARVAMSGRLALLPRVSGIGNFYKAGDVSDLSASALLGLEWRIGKDRLTPAIGPTWRWYGGSIYARTNTAALDWLHTIDRKTQVVLSGSAARARYRRNALQDGNLFDVSATVERALSPRAGVGGAIGATRQGARDPGYATVSGYASLTGWHDLGRTTVFAGLSLRRTEGDARLFLFRDRRREWLSRASIGATLRSLTWHGFAPLVRGTFERNGSSVGLYDYRRFAGDLGITRAF